MRVFLRSYLKEIFHVLAMVTGLAISGNLYSQTLPTPTVAGPRLLTRVFVDCGECDAAYLSEQLTFVNIVRDRLLADVGVMVTSLTTGSGGQKFSIELLERVAVRAKGDTVEVQIPHDASERERREEIVRAIKVALLPFIRGTVAEKHINVTYVAPVIDRGTARGERDPWHQWVFRTHVSGSYGADDNYQNASFDGQLSAARVTDAIKFDFSLRSNYTREHFKLSDGNTVVSERRGWSARSLSVQSLGDHFSLGVTTFTGSSIFDNSRLQVRVMPAVEYDVFPYRDATQRQLVARYAAGVRSMRYVDTTIYNRISESHAFHELTMVSDIRQKNGSIWGSMVWSQYLHDTSKRRFTVNAGIDRRIVAGLNLNFSANYAFIRDQLNVPATDLTNEERLLRLRQLQSGFEFSAGIGLTYTFGSVFNNVVNPRFRL